jgi:hypothetical protein
MRKVAERVVNIFIKYTVNQPTIVTLVYIEQRQNVETYLKITALSEASNLKYK